MPFDLTLEFYFGAGLSTTKLARANKGLFLRCFSHLSQDLTHQEKKKKLQKLEYFNEHPIEIQNIFIGGMLGDGYAQRRLSQNANTRINYKFGEVNLNYAKYIHSVLSEKGYCNPNPLKIKSEFHKKTGKYNNYIIINTYMFKSLNELHKLFYRKPTLKEIEQLGLGCRYIKCIPKNIDFYLNSQALAIWIMEDGSFHKLDGRVKLSTDSFSSEEVELLVLTLKNKFNLNWRITKANIRQRTKEQQYVLYLSPLLISLVKPFMIPSMLYKLGLL
jgi:hypothetical protein